VVLLLLVYSRIVLEILTMIGAGEVVASFFVYCESVQAKRREGALLT